MHRVVKSRRPDRDVGDMSIAEFIAVESRVVLLRYQRLYILKLIDFIYLFFSTATSTDLESAKG